MLGNGHQHARKYPLAMVWTEAQLVRERVNNLLASEVTLMHAAMVAIMAPKGAGNKNLNKMLKRLRNGN